METSHAQAGTTLLELILVLVITAILLTSTLPGFSDRMARVRLDEKIGELHSALQLARAQAVAMRQDVKFCPANSRLHCQSYSEVYALVFADLNDNNVMDPGDRPLGQIDLQGLRLQLRVSGARPYIRYKHSGDSKEWGSVNLCNRETDHEASRQLVVNLGGRVRIAEDYNGDGLADDYRGWQVICR